jgi:iron complex transport system permease protein
LIFLGVLFPVVLLTAAALGAVNIGIADLWRLLTGSTDVSEILRAIFWDIRLPRVLLAALVGSALALAGAGVQGLFRNPLADPALIGVSAGAALGAVLCFFLGWQGALGGWLLPLAAFAGGWLAVLLLGVFNSGFAGGGTAKLILAGVALNAMIGSVLGFFLFSATDDALRSMTFWTLGSCASAQWSQVAVLCVFLVVGGVLLSRNARFLDALQLGDDQAAHLGVSV